MNGHVVVAGAGIGGMAAAVLLAQASAETGAEVTLLERAAEIGAVGAGLLVQPNGLAVLAGAGLDAPLRSGGRPIGAVVVRGPAGNGSASCGVPEPPAGCATPHSACSTARRGRPSRPSATCSRRTRWRCARSSPSWPGRRDDQLRK